MICNRLLAQLDRGKLALMEGLRPDLPLILEAVNNILVAPSDFVRKALHCTVLPPWLQSEDPQSFRYYHSLLPVIRRGHAFEKLQAFKGGRTAGALVGNHASDGTEQNFGRCAVVEWARFFGVDNMAFVKEVVVAKLVTEEAT